MFLLFSNLEGVVLLNGNYFLEIHFRFYNETISSSSLKVSLTRNSEGPVQMSRPNIRRSNVPWLKKFCWTPPTLGLVNRINIQPTLYDLYCHPTGSEWRRRTQRRWHLTFNSHQLTDWLTDWKTERLTRSWHNSSPSRISSHRQSPQLAPLYQRF